MTDDPTAGPIEDAELEAELIEEEEQDVERDLADLVADQEETPFDETRTEYSGVEEGDGDVDVEGLEEAGAAFDDPEHTVLMHGGMDDPDGSDGWA